MVILRLDQIPGKMARLAEMIRQDGFIPDHVVYIETAGWLPGQALARLLGCSCSGMQAERKGQRFKRLAAPILGRLPAELAHRLRQLELDSGFHRREPGRQVRLAAPLPDGCRRIVLFDDAVDTGYSMLAAFDYLQQSGLSRSDVLTAAITITGTDTVFRPDLSLYLELITFPWSPGSPDWGAFRALERNSGQVFAGRLNKAASGVD